MGYSELISFASTFTALLLIVCLAIVVVYIAGPGKRVQSPYRFRVGSASSIANRPALGPRWFVASASMGPQWKAAASAAILSIAVASVFAGGFLVGRTVEAESNAPDRGARSATIHAFRSWQDTGIRVVEGQRVVIIASGVWSNQRGASFGPEGGTRTDGGTIMPSAKIGALVGRIGDSAPFVVGEGTAVIAASSGPLQLVMNDWPNDREDAYGSVTARIWVLQH